MPLIQTPSIAAVVEDQTPQLGGVLDCQNYDLSWDGGIQCVGLLGTSLKIGSGSTFVTIAPSSAVNIQQGGSTKARWTESGGYESGGDIKPLGASGFYNLGSSSLKWANVYTQDVTASGTLNSEGPIHVYNFGSDGDANYERLEVKWDTNVAYVGPASAGTGTNRNFTIKNGAKNFLTFSDSEGKTIIERSVRPALDSSLTLGTPNIRWSNTYTDTITIGDGVDAVLTADAADELALRNGTNAQKMSVYNTWTDGANNEALSIGWDTNVATIETTAAGTGTQRNLKMTAGNSNVQVGDGLVYLIAGGSLNFFAATGSNLVYKTIKPNLDSTASSGDATRRWATTYTNGIATNVETFTAASDTLDEKNNVCLCDCTSNAVTLALPVPVAGLQFHIKKIDGTANTVSIEPDDPGPELIDGAIVQTLSSQYDSITVVSDGSNWFVI